MIALARGEMQRCRWQTGTGGSGTTARWCRGATPSVGECLSHLVNSNKLYLVKIENILNSFPTSNEKDFPYKQSFLGKLITKGVDPASVRNSKTFKVFFPASSNIQKNIIDEYVMSSEKLIELVGKMQHFDLKKIKLSSPVNILIRQNLGDPLIIIPLHNERHLNQAKRVIVKTDFPKVISNE